MQDIPELRDGFTAIGFGEAGIVFRYYLEIEKFNNPPIKRLITIASPLGGFFSESCACCDQLCNFLCKYRSQIYYVWAQEANLLAGHFTDPHHMDDYFGYNVVLL